MHHVADCFRPSVTLTPYTPVHILPTHTPPLPSLVPVLADLIAALAAVLELYAGYEGDMHALDAAHHSHELLAVLLQCTQDVCEGAFKRECFEGGLVGVGG